MHPIEIAGYGLKCVRKNPSASGLHMQLQGKAHGSGIDLYKQLTGCIMSLQLQQQSHSMLFQPTSLIFFSVLNVHFPVRLLGLQAESERSQYHWSPHQCVGRLACWHLAASQHYVSLGRG